MKALDHYMNGGVQTRTCLIEEAMYYSMLACIWSQLSGFGLLVLWLVGVLPAFGFARASEQRWAGTQVLTQVLIAAYVPQLFWHWST